MASKTRRLENWGLCLFHPSVLSTHPSYTVTVDR